MWDTQKQGCRVRLGILFYDIMKSLQPPTEYIHLMCQFPLSTPTSRTPFIPYLRRLGILLFDTFTDIQITFKMCLICFTCCSRTSSKWVEWGERCLGGGGGVTNLPYYNHPWLWAWILNGLSYICSSILFLLFFKYLLRNHKTKSMHYYYSLILL